MLDPRGLYQRLTQGIPEIPRPGPGFFFRRLPLDIRHARGQSSLPTARAAAAHSASPGRACRRAGGGSPPRSSSSLAWSQRADEVIIDIDSPQRKLEQSAAATSSGQAVAAARPPVSHRLSKCEQEATLVAHIVAVAVTADLI